MLAFLELTPRFKKLRRRASLEFCVHLDMSQIGIVCFTKLCLGFSKFRILNKLKENFLATQAFANSENISEPQTGIEPATF